MYRHILNVWTIIRGLKAILEADDIILKHIGFMSTQLVETMQISWSLQHLKIK